MRGAERGDRARRETDRMPSMGVVGIVSMSEHAPGNRFFRLTRRTKANDRRRLTRTTPKIRSESSVPGSRDIIPLCPEYRDRKTREFSVLRGGRHGLTTEKTAGAAELVPEQNCVGELS